MNITFPGAGENAASYGTDKVTTAYIGSAGTTKVKTDSFALDISGTVTDNSAYAGHGKTAEEVMQQAGAEDITARRNYMAVMSNSMSDEDFARLQEEGYDPSSMDVETVVTILDEIKAALVKGGTNVVGYTDTLDTATLTKITGSETFAQSLQQEFAANDLPMTAENMMDAAQAYEKIADCRSLTDGELKFVVENELEPTPEHLYLAKYVGAGNGGSQGQGYYRIGAEGYYAKKPDQIDYEQLMPQMENLLTEVDGQVNEVSMEDARWLIEQGIPLNEDTYTCLKEWKGLTLPVSEETFAARTATAILDGKRPKQASLTKQESFLEQARSIYEKTQELTAEDADTIDLLGLPFTLTNLVAAHAGTLTSEKADGQTHQTTSDVQTKQAQLQEVRLTMTISANRKLLQSGFQIDTAPIEELLLAYQDVTAKADIALTGDSDPVQAREKAAVYRSALDAAMRLSTAPAVLAAEVSGEDTLEKAAESSTLLTAALTKAGREYELLMTQPRGDLGDSIKKAFQNTDALLQDMNLAQTEENRKTVRILSYNHMELNEENFKEVLQSERVLTSVTEKLRPQAVLSLIRSGKNPLVMTLDELNDYLSEQEQATGQELESYSKFLYRMEQKKEISDAERDAYIGIYRLFRQIEKGDDRAVGTLAATGREQTLANLLTAVRSAGRRMDSRAGDSTVQSTVTDSIAEQIENGRIHTRQQLSEAFSGEDTAASLAEQQAEEFRDVVQTETAAYTYLTDYGLPVSADNLLAASQLLYGQENLLEQIRNLTVRSVQKSQGEDLEAGRSVRDTDSSTDTFHPFDTETFLDSLTDTESAQNAYTSMTDHLVQELTEQAFEAGEGYLDIRQYNSLCKQVGFLRSMAREENFTVPMEIDGEQTLVNLKMIHRKDEKSKVTITLKTEALGKNAAEFSFTDDLLSGCSICSKKEGTALLKEQEGTFRAMLAEEDLLAGECYFFTEEHLHPEEYSLKAEAERETGTTAAQLYRAASVYIRFVAGLGRKEV